ncbi:MAG: Nif3-like dinuclear metal center hexameric protein [Ruminococcus sp.]|nr:Nif3-like dinuclear metal center hexameric protein [Ruminococcus sp.]
MLDSRLNKCLELVSGKGAAVDVGTDHALLASELINTGKCSRVIASDIKAGPLDAAKRTVEKCGIADKVTLILSDGLDNVPLDGVTDIVIAGMGGETIAGIIENTAVDRYDREKMRWILQPMTKPELLRKKLYEFHMQIVEEYAVEDGDKLYVVMAAEYAPDFHCLTEFDSLYGFFDNEDKLGAKLRQREAARLEKIAVNLKNAGKISDSTHYTSLAYKMKKGVEKVKISEIYNYFDSLYPFEIQEKWDNSGLLVENQSGEADTVVLALDITNSVVSEASCKGADLVISHHPVIFDPLKRITITNPVHGLIWTDTAAICMHTNLDIADGGTNGTILRKFKECFRLAGEPEPFEEIGGGQSLGWIVQLDEKICTSEFAEQMKEIFDCEYVRFNGDAGCMISRIAFCSGSGGSMLGLAVDKGCDALITGDVKHDVWIDAGNRGISVFDCGHFHTENIVLPELRRVLEERFPQLDVEIAENSADPCQYV